MSTVKVKICGLTREADMLADPIDQFEEWFALAVEEMKLEANVMSLHGVV